MLPCKMYLDPKQIQNKTYCSAWGKQNGGWVSVCGKCYKKYPSKKDIQVEILGWEHEVHQMPEDTVAAL